MTSLASHLGGSICNLISAFHTLTGCDYTSPFFDHSNFTAFKRICKQESVESQLTGLTTETINYTSFITDQIEKRTLRKIAAFKIKNERRHSMIFTRRIQLKGEL